VDLCKLCRVSNWSISRAHGQERAWTSSRLVGSGFWYGWSGSQVMGLSGELWVTGYGISGESNPLVVASVFTLSKQNACCWRYRLSHSFSCLVLITPVKPFSCLNPHTILSPALAEYNLLYSPLLFSTLHSSANQKLSLKLVPSTSMTSIPSCCSRLWSPRLTSSPVEAGAADAEDPSCLPLCFLSDPRVIL
jgi:hypothetical protein